MFIGYLTRHKKLKKIVSLVALCAFSLCFTFQGAQAAIDKGAFPYEMPGTAATYSQFSNLDVETFTVPEHLGEVKYSFKGDSEKLIVHIQDAHCNKFAQHKISDIIDYLNKEYGISVVNLEGGVGDYDLGVFTSITGEAIRQEVADYFVKTGEINGAELYAINNPERVALWGIEDEDLYLENLKVYRDSLGYKEEVDKFLKELTHILNNLKRHIYTQELLRIDMAYNAYKAGNSDFREYLEFLIARAKEKGMPVKQFPNLYLLGQAMDLEDEINFRKANMERNVLVDELKDGLSKNEARELVSKSVNFKTKRISRRAFYDYLLGKARELGIKVARFPALSNYIVYVTIYESVDRYLVMDELEKFEFKIKEPLYQNDIQPRLNMLSRNLALMKNIFAITLTKSDYRYYLKNEHSFGVQKYLKFIEKEAPKYRIKARPGNGIARLDDYREKISNFYEYSFKRDEAFLRNLRFKQTSEKTESAIMMTGGFHTENLCELLEKEDISYVSILPKFTSETNYQSHYFDLLAGQTANLQRMLSSVIAKASMMAIAAKFSDPDFAKAVWGKNAVVGIEAAIRLMADRGVEFIANVEGVTLEDNDVVFHMKGGTKVRKPISYLRELTSEDGFQESTSALEVNKWDEFEQNFTEGDYIISADGPKMRATNDFLGREGTNWFLEELRKLTREFSQANSDVEGFYSDVPAKGSSSDEFSFGFSGDKFTRESIESKMAELYEAIRTKFSNYGVISILRELTDKEAEMIKALQTVEGIISVNMQGWTTIIYDKNEINPLETQFSVSANATIKKKLEIGADNLSELRIPYLPMGVTRGRASESFVTASKRSDKTQEDHKNISPEEGGRLITFDEDVKPGKKEHFLELSVEKDNIKHAELGISKRAKQLTEENPFDGSYILESDYGSYRRIFLGEIVRELLENPSKKKYGTYIIRGPPDIFYVVQLKKDNKVELFKIVMGYIATEESRNVAERFMESEVASGRVEQARLFEKQLGKGNQQFGFKALNSTFGHRPQGNQILEIMANTIYEGFNRYKDKDMVGREFTDELGGEINKIFTAGKSGFEVVLQVAHVTAKAPESKQDTVVDIGTTINRVDELLEAWGVIRQDSITDNKHLFKDDIEYRGEQNKIDQEVQETRTRQMKRAKEVLDEADPQLKEKAKILFKAVKAKMQVDETAGACREILKSTRPGKHMSVTVVQVPEGHKVWDGSKYVTLSRSAERTFRREYGVNMRIVYYIAGEAKQTAEEVKRIFEDKKDRSSRFVVFADKDSYNEAKTAFGSDIIKDGLSGIVKGTFIPSDATERFSMVALATLGLGLMEWDRAVSDGKATEDIENSVKLLLMQMVNNAFGLENYIETTCNNSGKTFLENLLKGLFLIDIKRINYEEIRDYMESESAVLESL